MNKELRSDSAFFNISFQVPPEVIREYFDGVAKVESSKKSLINIDFGNVLTSLAQMASSTSQSDTSTVLDAMKKEQFTVPHEFKEAIINLMSKPQKEKVEKIVKETEKVSDEKCETSDTKCNSDSKCEDTAQPYFGNLVSNMMKVLAEQYSVPKEETDKETETEKKEESKEEKTSDAKPEKKKYPKPVYHIDGEKVEINFGELTKMFSGLTQLGTHFSQPAEQKTTEQKPVEASTMPVKPEFVD